MVVSAPAVSNERDGKRGVGGKSFKKDFASVCG